MSEIAIKVEDLSKLYRIGVKEEKYKTLAGTLNNFIKAPLSNFRRLQSLKNFKNPDSNDVIWALKDINFEIKQGEAVGIIGRNGAGKSTLLKILSRITDPTHGRITINGRVASLLEVGTGFNAELTGRENIYLNGTILGMRRREIDRKLDEIIDFSGVEKFIDTPVKRYSSGMYVRLAFAVAAHLEPEILIIDEVLAVGDAEFQRKCLGKMDEVAKGGRTVLFVSHNMGAILNLCSKACFLDKGRLISTGMSKEIVDLYIQKNDFISEQNDELIIRNNDKVIIQNIELINLQGKVLNSFYYEEPFSIRLRLKKVNPMIKPSILISFQIRNSSGSLIMIYLNNSDNVSIEFEKEEIDIELKLEKNYLHRGKYFLTIWLGDIYGEEYLKIENILSFTIESISPIHPKISGVVKLPVSWKISNIS